MKEGITDGEASPPSPEIWRLGRLLQVLQAEMQKERDFARVQQGRPTRFGRKNVEGTRFLESTEFGKVAI